MLYVNYTKMSIANLISNEEKISRVGKKWVDEEDAILIEEITNKIPLEDIALEHKRTIVGIKSRIISKIMYPKYKNDNVSMDDLSIEYNIEKELVEEYINKIEERSKNKKVCNVSKVSKVDDNKIEEKCQIIMQYKKWDKEQDRQLLDLYSEGFNIDMIANKCSRTKQAIKLRLANLCFNYFKNDMIIIKDDIICKYHNIS
jgi:hypothetical protein